MAFIHQGNLSFQNSFLPRTMNFLLFKQYQSVVQHLLADMVF